MDHVSLLPLVALVATQLLIYAAGWWLCGWFLIENRVAVLHWGLFMLLMGAGFVLAAQRGEPRTWWAFAGCNLLYISGYIALWRGMELFMRMRVRCAEQLGGLLLAALVFGGLGAEVDAAPWRVVAVFGGSALVVGRSVWTVFPAIRAEFGLSTSVAVMSPAGVVLGVSVFRALQQLLDMDQPLEMQRLTQGNVAMLHIFVAAAGTFNFSFLALLIMRLVRRLQEQSRHDALTGLLNRRGLDEALQREWQRFRRFGTSFAAVMLDLDHFKRVNDRHGHAAGDQVLEQTARRLANAARGTDTVARQGGEEFIVLMPGVDANGAALAAARLLALLRDPPHSLEGQLLPMTASAGVAVARAEDSDLSQVLLRADQALYRAKAEGRDRVVVEAAAAILPT